MLSHMENCNQKCYIVYFKLMLDFGSDACYNLQVMKNNKHMYTLSVSGMYAAPIN